MSGPVTEYNRQKALDYSHRWALSRNPAYYDFTYLGGDCTNFISQCIYAGSRVMNFTKDLGWYYYDLNNRAPAWTGVPYLYNFLTRKAESPGPFGEEVSVADVEPGDIIQLAFSKDGVFRHSLFIVETGSPVTIHNILINTHTNDRQNYPLTQYYWSHIRFIKILGVRY